MALDRERRGFDRIEIAAIATIVLGLALLAYWVLYSAPN
jgi:hypothetical protein